GNAATQKTRTVNVVNDPPVISAFTISPDPAFISSSATFNWAVDDVNGDILTCQIDVNNDGSDEYTINDCENNTSQIHTYTIAGDYTAKLTVSDGIAAPVTQTLDFTVIAPLSTDVSVNGPAVAGERVLYTITVGNTTALPIDGVSVSLVVPTELSFIPGNDTDPNSSNCGNNLCTATEEASWTLGTLTAGESRTIFVNAFIDVATLNGVTIALPVTYSATSISDIQINKNVDVYNTPSADLAVSASTDPVVANETFTYQLDFGNTSAGSLTTTELSAFLPDGVTVVSISDGGTEPTTGEVVWTEGTVGVGASLHREITVIAGAGLTAGQILKTTAQLTHDGGQAIDNTAEHALTVVSTSLPLEVAINTSANPIVANERVLYTLTVSNSSLLPVNDVDVLLRVPAELSFIPGNDTDPNSTNCGNNTCTATEEAGWALGTLAAGESRTISVNALVASVLSGNLITTPVRVTATGLGDTINLSNTVAVYNTPSADLAVSASTDPVVANETFTYQLDFGNTSAGSLTTTTLSAFLPAGVTVSSISDGGTEVTTGVVVWSEGTVVAGASVHREISVVADGVSTGDILTLYAELSHDGGLEVDNSSGFSVTVTGSGSIASLLSVDIAATPEPVASSGILAYTITVTNNFGLPVNDVNVLLRVPAELSFTPNTDTVPISSNCGNNVCTATEEASWTLGTMAAGATQVITINATVGAALGDGTIVNVPVRVTATGMEDTINLQHITFIDN
ncbi:MAG: DUF11 domain-containing protein, partial [Aestuariibacter sp.]|nr:DUF11 domain-containing protein [Aestuariibacter sp.]